MVKKIKYFAMAIALFAACSPSQKNLWEEMILRDGSGRLYFASSELENRGPYVLGPYGAHNLFDGNPATCWSEGAKGDGIGESVSVVIDEGTKMIILRNGYAKNNKVFRDNNRIKNMQLSVLAGIHIPGEASETGLRFSILPFKKTKTITLADSMKPQEIDFPFRWRTLARFKKSALRSFKNNRGGKRSSQGEKVRTVFILKMKILSVYKGAQYNDTCLSSVSFEKESEDASDAGGKRIYVNEFQNAILITDENGTTDTLVRDTKSIFQIVDVSDDSKWLIAICMPSDISETRIETNYRLYNTELKKVVPSRLIADGAGELYGFDGKGEETFLMYADNKEMADKKVSLSGILNKLQ